MEKSFSLPKRLFLSIYRFLVPLQILDLKKLCYYTSKDFIQGKKMTLEEIKELIKTVDESGISELKVKNDNFNSTISKDANNNLVVTNNKQMSTPILQTTPSEPQVTQTSQEGENITSPMVGTFYQSPSPDSPAFVKVGDTVSKGQTLAIIEAMKIMNEWEVEFDCKIIKLLVDDGQAVEYGTPIFEVEKING